MGKPIVLFSKPIVLFLIPIVLFQNRTITFGNTNSPFAKTNSPFGNTNSPFLKTNSPFLGYYRVFAKIEWLIMKNKFPIFDLPLYLFSYICSPKMKMIPDKKYNIQIGSLDLGIHNFKFEVDGAFFEKMENETITKCDIQVNITLNKQNSLMTLEFSINGTVNLPCDRCSENFDLIISGNNKLIVKMGNDFQEESEEVIVVPKNDPSLDISQYIYEFVLLLIPMKVEHPLDANGKSQCNEELIKLLEKYQPKEKNEGEEDNIDPRWERLKGLK